MLIHIILEDRQFSCHLPLNAGEISVPDIINMDLVSGTGLCLDFFGADIINIKSFLSLLSDQTVKPLCSALLSAGFPLKERFCKRCPQSVFKISRIVLSFPVSPLVSCSIGISASAR